MCHDASTVVIFAYGTVTNIVLCYLPQDCLLFPCLKNGKC